ncbi:unnamed protein product [Heterobilharzia americana]|nr:unnamed protein product [Heterobilharzia americana]
MYQHHSTKANDDSPYRNKFLETHDFPPSPTFGSSTNSQMITPVIYNSSASSSAAVTGLKRHFHLEPMKDEQFVFRSSGIKLSDNLIRPRNRRAYMTRSANLVYDTLDDFSDNYPLNDRYNTIAPVSSRIHSDNNTNNNNNINTTSKPVNHRDISENQYCIQFKRVKARRTSSSSQAECSKTAKSKAYTKDRPNQDYLQSKVHSPNRINEDYPDSVAIHSGICPINDLPQDQEPMKKHVETWLKEAVTRTIQGKAQLRRSHMSHVSSGEAQREPPETVTPQPHSFDGPVSRYHHDDCLFTTGYSQNKPISISLNTSTDSPHIKPPSITRDGIDGYVPYYYESVFDKYADLNNNGDENLNLSPHDHTKVHRRHSDNPMSEIIGDKTLKSTHKPTFTHYNNYTTHNGNSSQRGIDYAAANELPTINNDRLLITNISRERASSFQESNKVNREYVYQKNEQDVCNSKTLLYNPNNTSNNISHGRHVNVMYKSTERSVNPTHLKQSHSFSERQKISKLPTVTSLPEKYRLTHTLSEENRTNIMPLTLNKMNPPQSLRQIISLKKCLQMPTESSYNQHTNYELQNKRGSKYSNMLEPNSSIDCAIFHQPHPSMHSERRYSRHLKPLDAWQSRQSHSMEIVNTTAANQRSLSSPQKRGPLSKQTAIRKLPPIYSRSLQHSTCSFPVHWGGFLSGPTLSLTSAFDSSSLTPDSLLNHKHFFRSSLDSHEPIQPILLQQQQLQQRSQQSYRGKFSASKEHAYSASESPQNLIPLEESLTNSRHIKSLHQSRINLSPSSYSHHNGSNLTQPITRKVHSFELNSNPRYQQLLPELVRNNSVLLKVNDIHQLGHSTHSSRRGSSNSNNSVFLSKEWKYSKSKLSSEFSPVQNPISPYSNDNNNNNDKIVQQLIPQNCTAKPLEKLIPPDLIFSPASRRASMMDEDISGVQNSMLNVTGDLKEFYLNNLEYNDNNNTNSTTNATETNILIEPLHHQNYSEINFPKNRNNTNSFAKDNTEVNKLMPTHSYESDGQKYSSPNHYCLRYGRHKSADTFVSKNGINTMREFYSHRNSASVHQNTPHLSRTYLKSDQQSLTPPGSQLPVSINNGYRNSSEYQSHLHIACRSQIDMRNIDNGWDTMDRFVNKDSNSNLTNRHQHQAPNFNLTNNSKESYFLNVNDEKDDNVITGKITMIEVR